MHAPSEEQRGEKAQRRAKSKTTYSLKMDRRISDSHLKKKKVSASEQEIIKEQKGLLSKLFDCWKPNSN